MHFYSIHLPTLFLVYIFPVFVVVMFTQSHFPVVNHIQKHRMLSLTNADYSFALMSLCNDLGSQRFKNLVENVLIHNIPVLYSFFLIHHIQAIQE